MVQSVSNNNNNVYVQRSREETEAAFLLATLASGAIMGVLPYFSKPFLNQMEKENANNKYYRDAFIKSFEQSGLKEKGVKILNTTLTDADRAKIAAGQGKEVADLAIKEGKNACYVPSQKIVKANFDTTAITGFHECGHAMNHLKSKFGKFLQKLRGPGYAIAGLMGTIAIFSRKKPKGTDRNAFDVVQDNCGKIAFLALLPTVAEEALASHKGIKMARAGGLSEPLIKNLKKFYGKALLTYIGYAVAAGLSTFAASKITEIFTRPKIVKPQSSNLATSLPSASYTNNSAFRPFS